MNILYPPVYDWQPVNNQGTPYTTVLRLCTEGDYALACHLSPSADVDSD